MLQSHGAVVVIDPTRRTVLQASANTGVLLGRDPAALLGFRLEAALGLDAGRTAANGTTARLAQPHDDAGAPAAHAARAGDEAHGGIPGDIPGGISAASAFHWVIGAGAAARHLYVTREVRAGREILVLMPEAPSHAGAIRQATLLHELGTRLDRAPSTGTAGAVATMVAAALTRHERALLLRYDPAGHADVVADWSAGADSWVDLRIAAEHLPWRADDLRADRIHVIVDVDDPGVALVGDTASSPPLGADETPLASPSAEHAARLRALGAVASVACAVLDEGDVRYAIVTLHGTAHAVAPTALPALRAVATALAERLRRIHRTAEEHAVAAAADLGTRLGRVTAQRDTGLVDALVKLEPGLRECFLVDGLAVSTRAGRQATGSLRLASGFEPALAIRAPEGVLVTTDLVYAFPRGALGDAAGIVAIELDAQGSEWLVLARRARPQTIKWLRLADGTPAGAEAANDAPHVHFETLPGRCLPFEPWVRAAATALRNAYMTVKAHVERERADRLARDAEAARRAQERDWRVASVDPGSGLVHGTAFEHSIEGALREARRAGRVAVLLAAHLDNVEDLVDAFGFGADDQAVVALAERMRAHLPGEALVARLGSERIAAVVTVDAGQRAIENLLGRLREAAAGVVEFGGRLVILTATVGMACDDGRQDARALLRAAAAGLAQARISGPGSVAVAPAAEELPDAAALETAMRTAIDRRTLALAFQPIVRVNDGALVAMEALVRLHDPALGAIPATRVIPVSERSGLLPKLTDYVLALGLRERKGWEREWDAPVALSVNVSPSELLLPGFSRRVLDALEEQGTPPDRLRIEITDSATLRQSANAQVALANLQVAGVRIALDDFGGGRSGGTIELLRALRPDAIKLDASIVQDAAHRPENREIAEAVVRMAEAMGLGVVAVGVETPEQLALVRNTGCHEAQGFLVGRPLPPAGAAGYVRTLRSFSRTAERDPQPQARPQQSGPIEALGSHAG